MPYDELTLVGGFCHKYFYLCELGSNKQLLKIDTGGRNRTHDLSILKNQKERNFVFVTVDHHSIQFVKAQIQDSSSR